MSEDLERFERLQFVRSRIPAQDALELFVPTAAPPDPELNEIRSRTGQSRWYPVDGGHRILILYEAGPFDTDRFTLAKGAWDHEQCTRCRDRVEPMTLCWVTADGPYMLLDEKCHQLVFGPRSTT